MQADSNGFLPNAICFYPSSYRYSSTIVFASNFSHMALTCGISFHLILSSTSTSMYFPTRTLPAFLNPSESSACSIAFPCGSRIPCFNVT